MNGFARILRRAWLGAGWLGVLAVIYLSLTSSPVDLDVVQGDKLLHVAAYAALMLWFAQPVVASPARVRVALALTGLGITLELAQLATGYRTFSYGDMASNAAGVALAWWSAPQLPNVLTIAERATSRRAAG